MAIASREEAVTEVKVIEPARITLTISEEEAAFLVDVFANIGGCAVSTRRKHSDALAAALYRLGVRGLSRDSFGYVPDISKSRGAIYFERV